MINKDISKIIEKLGLLPVVPCRDNMNYPKGISWHMEENWITDLEQLNNVLNSNRFKVTKEDGTTWTAYNITGIGLLTGTRSGIIIVDLDMHTKNGKLINGIANFEQWLLDNNIDKNMVYNTFTVVSPTGGGKHLYYKYDKEVKGTIGVVEGVDIRAEDNQVPIPYTNRLVEVDGEEVLKQYEIENDVPILDLPKELEALLTTTNNTVTNGSKNGYNKGKLDLIEIWNNGIPDGERNVQMMKVGGRIRPSFSRIEDFAFCMLAINNALVVPPLDLDNLAKKCETLWNVHINNTENNFPYPFRYDEENNCMCVVGDDEEDKQVIIYRGYLNLVGRRINIEDNTTQYILESKDLNDYNRITVDGATLFGSNAERDIKTLFAEQKGFCNFGAGAKCTPKRVLEFLVLQDEHKRKNNLMQDTYYSNNIGWVVYNDRKYMCYPSVETVIDTIECNSNIKKVTKAFNTKGTVQEWIDNVLKLLITSDNGKVMLISTFASLLVNLLDIHENSIIQLEGQSSTGKSGCIAGCSSVFGEESKYVQTWEATKNGAVGLFAGFGSFPLIFDDLKNVDAKLKRELPSLFYGFVQGEEKTRGTVDGSIRNSRTFNSLLITSGEYPVTDDLKGHEGATARVLVLPGSFLPKSKANATIVNNIYKNSKKYYGTVGVEWCKYLVALKNSDKVKEYMELYETYREILVNKTNNNLVARKCNTIALLQVTGFLLEDFFGQDFFNMEALIENLLNIVEETTKEADTNTNAFMDVVEQLKLNVTDENDIYNKGTCIGSYRYKYNYDDNQYGEVLIVQSTILKGIIEELGYNANTTIRAWADKGYIVKDNKNKNSVQNKINGKNVRTTVLVLSYYKELTNSGADLTLVPKNKTATDLF